MTSRCPHTGLGTRGRENKNSPLNVRRQSGVAAVAVPVLISAAPAWAQSGEAMAQPGPAVMAGLAGASAAFLFGVMGGR